MNFLEKVFLCQKHFKNPSLNRDKLGQFGQIGVPNRIREESVTNDEKSELFRLKRYVWSP